MDDSAEHLSKISHSQLGRVPEVVCRPYQTKSLVVFAFKRVFFFTSHGYLGLAQDTTQVGDVIAVIPDVTLPFLVRRTKSYYEIVDGETDCKYQ